MEKALVERPLGSRSDRHRRTVGHQEGVALGGRTRSDDLGNLDPRSVGPHRDEGLVFDETEPSAGDPGIGVPVGDRPPHRDQELAVPCVATVGPHDQRRAVAVGGRHVLRAERRMVERTEVVGDDPEVLQRRGDLGVGELAPRRPANEMDHTCRRHSECHGGRCAPHECDSEAHCGQRSPGDECSSEPSSRKDEVRRRRGDDRGDGGEPHAGEVRRIAGGHQTRPEIRPRTRGQTGDDRDRAHHQRQRDERIHRQTPLSTHHGGGDQEDRPQRDEPQQDVPQRIEPRGQPADDVRESRIERRRGNGADPGPADHDQRHDDQHHVGRPSPPAAVRWLREQRDADR